MPFYLAFAVVVGALALSALASWWRRTRTAAVEESHRLAALAEQQAEADAAMAQLQAEEESDTPEADRLLRSLRD